MLPVRSQDGRTSPQLALHALATVIRCNKLINDIYACYAVISTGGVIATHDLAQTGAIALETINRFVATRTIIGSGGVSKSGGLTEFDQVMA